MRVGDCVWVVGYSAPEQQRLLAMVGLVEKVHFRGLVDVRIDQDVYRFHRDCLRIVTDNVPADQLRKQLAMARWTIAFLLRLMGGAATIPLEAIQDAPLADIPEVCYGVNTRRQTVTLRVK